MLPVSPGAFPRKVVKSEPPSGQKLLLLKHSSLLFRLVLKWNGATTLSITTFSIMTLSIRDLYVTLSIGGLYVTLSIIDSQHK